MHSWQCVAHSMLAVFPQKERKEIAGKVSVPVKDEYEVVWVSKWVWSRGDRRTVGKQTYVRPKLTSLNVCMYGCVCISLEMEPRELHIISKYIYNRTISWLLKIPLKKSFESDVREIRLVIYRSVSSPFSHLLTET